MLITNNLEVGTENPPNRPLTIATASEMHHTVIAEVIDGEYIGEQLEFSHKIDLDVLGWWYYDTHYGLWFWEEHLEILD